MYSRCHTFGEECSYRLESAAGFTFRSIRIPSLRTGFAAPYYYFFCLETRMRTISFVLPPKTESYCIREIVYQANNEPPKRKLVGRIGWNFLHHKVFIANIEGLADNRPLTLCNHDIICIISNISCKCRTGRKPLHPVYKLNR